MANVSMTAAERRTPGTSEPHERTSEGRVVQLKRQLHGKSYREQAKMLAPDHGAFAPIQRKPNNSGLPDNLKQGVESLSGLSMDDVKVHYNSPKPAQVQALAYTQGTDIHVGPGQEQHLPHEAWHVVQQAQGRVEGTQAKGQINSDSALEQEADVQGAKAAQAGADGSSSRALRPIRAGLAPVRQMKWEEKDESEAQEKLTPMDGEVYSVPVDNVLNQQAWASGFVGAVRLPKPLKGILQSIAAGKVVRAAQSIMEGKTVNPPPVAFSTKTAKAANPQSGELILLDSHHTTNAAKILSGASTIKVKHSAALAEMMASGGSAKKRRIATANKERARRFNADGKGFEAFQEAIREIFDLQAKKAEEIEALIDGIEEDDYNSEYLAAARARIDELRHVDRSDDI